MRRPPAPAFVRTLVVGLLALLAQLALAALVVPRAASAQDLSCGPGEKPLDFQRFNAVVQAQVKKLGEGGAKVAFQVAMKDGKVTLTANRED